MTMSITFNADEIFEIAEQIERNGAKFYRQAAGNTDKEDMKKMLLEMAEMEDGHLLIFQNMRKNLTSQEKKGSTFDPDNEAVMYLQAMADARSYEGRITPTEELTGNESTKEIIEIALNSEKESVLFYSGLRSLASKGAEKDKVEVIINEELNHITSLLNKLKSLE